jgi:hypothetical protein
MTTWINKDKFKDENFSVKEGFTELPKSSNPLEQFLKANPLKSVFDIEPIDSRTDSQVESFGQINDSDEVNKTFNPIYDQDSEDNINPIGTPDDAIFKGKYSTKINNKAENNLTRKEINADDKRIHSIMVSLFSLFITLYVSYNWYFNFTEGYTKRIKFYEKFDAVNYLYFFSEYFYKIVKFFDETATTRIPYFVKLAKESILKERFIFLLIFFISHYIVKSVISFLDRVYKYTKTFVETGKLNIMKLIYDPKSNNVYITLIFVFFVLEGVVSSFKSKYIDKVDPSNLDPSASFKESLTAFKVANPLYYFIFILIRVAIVYGPSVSFASSLFFIYFKFYSLFGILYYQKFNSEPIDEASLYNGVRDESFLDMFRRIHAVINVNRVLFEYTEEKGIQYWIEWISRQLFNNLPFLIMLFGLIRAVPSILKIYSPMFKWTGLAMIITLGLAIIKFMVEENPKMYHLQQQLISIINGSIKTVAEVFTVGKPLVV